MRGDVDLTISLKTLTDCLNFCKYFLTNLVAILIDSGLAVKIEKKYINASKV